MTTVIFGNQCFHKIFKILKWKNLLLSPSLHNNFTVIYLEAFCFAKNMSVIWRYLTTKDVGTRNMKVGKGPRFIAKLSCGYLRGVCIKDTCLLMPLT